LYAFRPTFVRFSPHICTLFAPHLYAFRPTFVRFSFLEALFLAVLRGAKTIKTIKTIKQQQTT